MENGDVAIPFACCFVMKRIENFDPIRCQVSVLMTLIMRIKFSGIEQIDFLCPKDIDVVKDVCRNQLKCRVHEEESLFNNGDSRSGRMMETRSKDSTDENDKDMFTFTMRVREMFNCNFHEYRNYPFD